MKKLASCRVWSPHPPAPTPPREGDTRPRPYKTRPAEARQFITSYFGDTRVSYAKVDSEWWDTTYEVVFVDGRKVEFEKDGAWKEVSCKYSQVPDVIVPPRIREYVTASHPGQKMVKIERSRREYEVKLDNGLDLTFDRNYNLIDIDD